MIPRKAVRCLGHTSSVKIVSPVKGQGGHEVQSPLTVEERGLVIPDFLFGYLGTKHLQLLRFSVAVTGQVWFLAWDVGLGLSVCLTVLISKVIKYSFCVSLYVEQVPQRKEESRNGRRVWAKGTSPLMAWSPTICHLAWTLLKNTDASTTCLLAQPLQATHGKALGGVRTAGVQTKTLRPQYSLCCALWPGHSEAWSVAPCWVTRRYMFVYLHWHPAPQS